MLKFFEFKQKTSQNFAILLVFVLLATYYIKYYFNKNDFGQRSQSENGLQYPDNCYYFMLTIFM